MTADDTTAAAQKPPKSKLASKERKDVVAMTAVSKRVHRLIRLIVAAHCRVLFRMEVRGQDRLPVAGPYILAPVHRSNLDALVAASSLPSSVVLRTMAKDSLWKASWFGKFLEKMGAFPIDRGHPDRAALRSCEQALAQGEPLLMFPEGRRMSGPMVDDILEGPAWLACRARVPIVPLGISGTDRAMPIGARLIRPSKVVVEIGEPLLPDVPLTGRVPHRAVLELTEQLRERIQDTYEVAKRG